MIAATEPLAPPPAPGESPAGPVHRHPGREPLVWLVAGIPLLTIVAGLVTLWIAFQRADSNVTEDYYKEGLAINRRIERDEQARAYRLAGHLTVSADRTSAGDGPSAADRAPTGDGPNLVLDLTLAGAPDAFEPQVTVRMTHPVRQSLDRLVVLHGLGAGRYRGQLEAAGLAGTRWTLAVETARWRLALPGLNRIRAGARLEVGPGEPAARS